MEVALIGVDGLDPDLVAEWRDDLPTLSRLIDGGTTGRLRSSDPPLSVPAWPTLYTGKQGGKHGVFGFTRRQEVSYKQVPVNFTDVKAESLWEALDASSVSCGVVNVPLSHPPSDLDDGFVISGWPVPNRADVCSDPAVMERLERDLGESYEVNPFPLTLEFDELETETLFEEIKDGLWHHQRAFQSLVRSHTLDCFCCVFMAIDIASHNFAYEREYLHDMYVEQDRALGELLDILPDNVEVVLVSDHGHGARGKLSFHVNEWLRESGYLAIEMNDESTLLERIGVTQRNYVRLKNALLIGNVHNLLPSTLYYLAKEIVPRGDGGEDFNPEAIDWQKTRAYSNLQNQLYLNTTGDHPEGIVSHAEADDLREELTDRLEIIDHPGDAGRLMTAVEPKSELFEGPFTDSAPDLVFIADDMECNAPKGFNGGEVFSDERWGEHRQYGILVTNGPSFADSDADHPRDITDVFPMVLSLLDVDVPKNVDGTVPDQRFRAATSVTFRESADETAKSATYSECEADEVREQLEGLGYLE